MSIRKRIIIAAVIQAIVICLICGFGYVSFKVVLTKLQAIEIIDDMNISLLEMRKAEKNYFLYKDLGSLTELVAIGQNRYGLLESAGGQFLRTIFGRFCFAAASRQSKAMTSLASGSLYHCW